MSSRRLLLALACTGFVLPLVLLHAAPPGWWGNDVIDSTKEANDFAVINQGQLKNLATQAAAELQAHCPGGQGEAVTGLLASWQNSTAATNDFAVVNLGQLKTVAKPFYDQLIAVGYITAYPWTVSGTPANNYAVANIGQVKNLFSFDLLSTDAAHDADGDGLPDWWETYYNVPNDATASSALPWDSTLTYLQALQRGLPAEFYHGKTPVLAIIDGNAQSGAPGELLPKALIVSVADNNQPWINAPVTFQVTQGQGTVQRSSGGTASQTVTVRTDYQGQARVYFKLPSPAPGAHQITATPAGYRAYTNLPVFTELADRPPGSNPSPFDPSNVVAIMNRDGSADVTWTNNADPDDTEPIDLMYKDRNSVWQVLVNVPAGTTSHHIPAPQ